MNHPLARPATFGAGVGRFAVLLLAASLLALALFGFTGLAGQAAAASPSGSFSFTLGYGPSGKALKKAGVRISAISPSTQQNLNGKRVRIESSLLASSSKSEFSLSGGIRFNKGKRRVVARKVSVNAETGRVMATVGGKRMAFFLSNPDPQLDEAAGTLTIRGAKLRMTAGSAKLIRTKLRIKRLPAAQVGGLAGKVTFPFEDPYVAQCGVGATSQMIGNLPEAAPLPVLSNAKDLVGPGSLSWGFKSSFRNYIIFGASGSLQAVAPATVQPGVPVASGFTFPVDGGQYAANNPIDTSDDQAIIPGTGTALLCATGHNFRVTVSNPTVVIDGDNSRIVADVDTNLSGVWTPTQRVDLADLDLTGVTPFFNRSGSEVSWGELSATFTEAGANAICGTGEQTACSYVAGTEMDPVEVSVKTAYDTTDLTALASYVETELPFPMADPAIGGCTLPNPTDGNRTIDAAQVASPTANPIWKPVAGAPVPAPDLSGALALNGGRFDWGFRSSLRGSLNSTGQFNLSPGVTASNTPYFGSGTGSVPQPTPPDPQTGGQMAGPGKFFRWPAAATAGFYDPAGPGDADDRLVLRTQGRVAFCQTNAFQVYGVVFSNPTVIIDGENSRITIDVATRYRLSWVRGTVDFAKLDIDHPGASFSSTTDAGTTTVQWSLPDAVSNVGPVELTAGGEAVVNMVAKNTYVAGLGLDGTTFRASFPAVEPVE
jgi:hypothetical protein